MFSHGDTGYHIDMRDESGKKISIMNYYCYQLMNREGNYILNGGRLSQQYIVDQYCKMESSRINFITNNQKKIRADEYGSFRDQLLATDDINVNDIGKRVILPASYVGGPRYMHQKQADAMAKVKTFGRPSLFITMTTNPKWPEIAENLKPLQSPKDRPDLIARIFCLKYKLLMDMITKQNIFGPILAYELSIEFQKRGLPHVHTLIWLKDPIRPDDIDKYVCAEIPHPEEDPELYSLVKYNMIHGTCGQNISERFADHACSKDGKGLKQFPKRLQSHTEQGLDSYPIYRHRSQEDVGNSVRLTRSLNGEAHELDIGNDYIVPYKPWLLRQFGCHINIEKCNSVKAIKYVLKYINKGNDQAAICFEKENGVQQHILGRYIGPT